MDALPSREKSIMLCQVLVRRGPPFYLNLNVDSASYVNYASACQDSSSLSLLDRTILFPYHESEASLDQTAE